MTQCHDVEFFAVVTFVTVVTRAFAPKGETFKLTDDAWQQMLSHERMVGGCDNQNFEAATCAARNTFLENQQQKHKCRDARLEQP